MIRAAATLGLLASPALADTVHCVMADGAEVRFVIDRNQFIDAVTPEEPIRRKVTLVRWGARQFPAEPFLIGEMRGFHAAGLGDSEVMFVVQPDGSAQLSNRRAGQQTAGTCEVSN